MSNSSEFGPLQQRETPFPSFMNLLKYMVGDKRLKDSFRYSCSIKMKIIAVWICLDEFMKCIPKYEEEMKILDREHFVQGIWSTMLVVKYETFLNAIYSLMENLAYVVRRIHDKHSLPYMFHDQRNKGIARIRVMIYAKEPTTPS